MQGCLCDVCECGDVKAGVGDDTVGGCGVSAGEAEGGGGAVCD